ncbi:HisA/HisF-related TIM barrel protein [Alistipes shahii]|uniref:1-(5-phosphoribosyl)-5-[(5- phosphoribosylamino)methylideneamino]imidazole-4- carboxamide isomerase n=1 Tax=Alistipes shahii TaxID=328814 RepID=UPI003AF97B90
MLPFVLFAPAPGTLQQLYKFFLIQSYCQRAVVPLATPSFFFRYFHALKSQTLLKRFAVRRPDLFAAWLAEFGPGRLILGADVRNGAVAIEGWLESSTLSAPELIGRFIPQGLTQVICTDISRDGMLCGPSAAFYADLQGRFPTVEITVSGGISSMSDIEELDRQGLRSVIVGKALYEGRITLKDLARCLPNA